jgi:putative ABC transport system permease protein
MYRDYLAWKEQSHSFDSLGGMFWRVRPTNGDTPKMSKRPEVTNIPWISSGSPFPVSTQCRTASLSMVTPEYFSVLSMRVLGSRSFSEFDNEHGEPVVIVNDLLARATFPGRDPIGQSIHISGESGRRKIVGVVTNTSTTFYNTLAWERKPRYYLPWMQTNTQGWSPVGGGWWIYLRVARSPAERELRRAVTTWNADAAVAVVEPMTKAVGDATAQPKLRTALGARRPQLLADVLRQAAVVVGTGLIAGIPLAMALSRQLRSMLYSVSPLDPAVFVFASAVLIGTAGVAAYLPARSASNVDPMEALRDE